MGTRKLVEGGNSSSSQTLRSSNRWCLTVSENSRFLASWTLQNWTVQALNHLPFLLLVWGPYGFLNFPSTKKIHELTQRLPEYTAPSATRMSKFKTQTRFNRQESSGWLHPCVSPSSYQPRNWRNDFPSLVSSTRHSRGARTYSGKAPIHISKSKS